MKKKFSLKIKKLKQLHWQRKRLTVLQQKLQKPKKLLMLMELNLQEKRKKTILQLLFVRNILIVFILKLLSNDWYFSENGGKTD